ncbi:MAG: hypothetical protein KDE28_21495, partial [Anaerolineales bacterium]|nr:hypothetical protein [Anaerolineales bacterium]
TDLSYSLDSPPDFSSLKTFPIPDSVVQAGDAADKLDEIIDIVNALASRHVFQYGNYQAWFTELGGDRECRYGQEFYHHPNIGTPENIDPTPRFELFEEKVLFIEGDHSTQVIRLQDLLNLYFLAPDSREKRLFRDACRVVARGRRISNFDLSTSFVLLVSSIESLIHLKHLDNKPEKCSECGQERYRVVRKFKDFLDEYCFQIDKKIKDSIYDRRSALVHRGQFLPFEQRQRYYVETEEDLIARREASVSLLDLENLQLATIACFRAFLFKEFGRALH